MGVARNDLLRSSNDNSRMSMTGRMIQAWRDGSDELFTGFAAYQGGSGNLEAQIDLYGRTAPNAFAVRS